MATTTVSDAIVWPQSQGTGLAAETSELDATLLTALGEHDQGEYVNTDLLNGCSFINHDGTNDTVDVDSGVLYIRDDSSSTSGNRDGSGNPQGESTTTSGYDFSFSDHLYVVVLPTSTTVDVSDSTLNQVWVNITDVTSQNSVEIRTDGGGGTTSQPSDTFLKLGEANPDDSSADTRANDDAAVTYRSTQTDTLRDDNGTELLPYSEGKITLRYGSAGMDAYQDTSVSNPIQSALDQINNNSDEFNNPGKLFIPPERVGSPGQITDWAIKIIQGLGSNYGSEIEHTDQNSDLFQQTSNPSGTGRDGESTQIRDIQINGNNAFSGPSRTSGSAINLNDTTIRNLSMDNVRFLGWHGPDPVIDYTVNEPFEYNWGYVECNRSTMPFIDAAKFGGTVCNCDMLNITAPVGADPTPPIIRCDAIAGNINSIYTNGPCGPLIEQIGTVESHVNINQWMWENTGSNSVSKVMQFDKDCNSYIGPGFLQGSQTIDDVFLLGDKDIGGITIEKPQLSGSLTINNNIVAINADTRSGNPVIYHGPTSDVRKTSNAPSTLTEPVQCADGVVQ